jgi:hypothetical protein
MSRLKTVRAVSAVVLLCGASLALAAPSCTNWMRQPDGSQGRTCVDDKGKQYCEEARNGSISRVNCR